ncbi:hypothetical protein PRK78_000281 [Emydomyces testavorans]|uniref:Uncharacterized protein n=1 Tax=Emydomyces testavorans TaxID=2070801 RepID=A0AAF0DAW7_9EURO|nr:hypothetical protein PRK78_000281 [Emydomyces testavorans]
MAWIRKVVVFAAFGCRIPIILVSIIRVTDIDGAVSPIDPTLRSVDSSISTEVLLHYSLMAATIPCLKPFVIAFNTGWGQGQGKGSSYVLRDSSAGTGKRFSRSVQRESVPPTPFRVNPYAHAAGATHATGDDEIEARPNTVESEESRRMVIRETRSWIVEHESYEMAQYASAGTHGHFGRVCSVTS